MRYKLIAGLGNPGTEYEATYHNVGVLALAAIAALVEAEPAGPAAWKKHKKLFEYAKGGNLLMVKPLTFMNVSGAAIKEAAKMCGAKPEEILILHDDSDLAIGAFKITQGQSAAGHHGVESVIASLGSNDFFRARIGVRPLEEVLDRKSGRKAGDFVLARIKKKDEAAFEEVFKKIAERVFAKE